MGGRGRLRYPNLSLAARMATLLRAAPALYAVQYSPIFLLFKPNGEHFLNIKRIQGFAGRAHGLDSSRFRGVRRDQDPDRRPAPRPSYRHTRPSYRHTRTCSGYPCGRSTEAATGGARNKSGHDGGGRPGMAQEPALSLPKGGPFGHGGGKRTGDATRAQNPRRPLARPRPMAKPDNSGTSPGITGRSNYGKKIYYPSGRTMTKRLRPAASLILPSSSRSLSEIRSSTDSITTLLAEAPRP